MLIHSKFFKFMLSFTECIIFLFLTQWFSTGGDSACPPSPGNAYELSMSTGIFVVTTGDRCSIASSGWRPGMLKNIPQYTGQPPITKSYSAPKVNTTKGEKSWFKLI